MYGTVARLRVKPGAAEQFLEFARAGEVRTIPGHVFEYVYQLDADTREFILVVGFTDKEAYVQNANSPEQDAQYRTFRELLEADPEWHDGEIADVSPRPT